jgi:hypothetical protein
VNILTLVGAFVVTLSLLSYGIGTITIERFKTIPVFAFIFLVVGLLLDIAETVLMIIGSNSTPFTLHGFIGYSAFCVMLVYVIMLTRFYLRTGKKSEVPPKLIIYTKISYGFWVIAYLTGSLLVIW